MKAKIRTGIHMLLAALMSLSVGFAQGRQAGKKAVAPKPAAPFLQHARSYEETPYVTRVVLKNGLTILVNEFRAQPVVSIQAHVAAGILDEPAANPGVAGLLAAMVCRGSPDKAQGTLRQSVQALGGFINCAVDAANARFEIIAPSSQWKKALGSLIEALSSPHIQEQEMKLEAGILAGEAREVLDNPGEFAAGRLFELGFDQPRMNRWKVLAAGALLGLTPANLQDFYKFAYVPEKTMLVVSGDISSGEALNEIVKVYKQSPGPGSKVVSMPFDAGQGAFRYAAMEGNIPLPRLLFGFHTPPANSRDAAAIQVLNAILGMGEGSILAVRLRDQKKLVLAAETGLTMQPRFGYLTVQMEVKPENIDRSEIALFTELELLRREAPDEADMERALAQLELAHWTSFETVSERAGSRARFESMGDWKRMDRRISELRQVKAEDVRRVAEKYLRLENCSLVEYLPVAAEKRRLTAETVRETLGSLLKASADQEQAERNRETVLALKIPQDAGNFKFSEIRYQFVTASILRGPQMFIREDHTRPVIDMGIFFPGGRPAEREGNSGITKLLARVMIRGAAEKSAAQFHRQLEVYGGKVRPVVAPDYFGFYFSILSRNFEAGLKLLLEAIKTPDLDRDEIARQKEIQSAEALGRRNSADYAAEVMHRALFRDFFYATEAAGTANSLLAIDQASLRNWYDAHIKNRKPLVVAIGDTKGTSLASYFVQHFSGSRMQDGKVPEGFAKALEEQTSLKEDWNRAQSIISIGFQAPPADDEDAAAATVLQSYAGDSGKLVQEIRDRQGTAYGISVRYEPLLRGGSMIVSASANPGSEEAALESLRKEIQRLTEGPVIYRDYLSAVNAAVGAYWINAQARPVQIAEVARQLLAGNGIEGYRNLAANLQAVREEDLKEVARRIFNMDRAVILQMRGAPTQSGEPRE